MAAIGLLVAGCSDSEGNASPTTEPAPEPSPTTTTEETTSPAPGPTPWPEPTRPEEMERDDIEGAEAAARHFMQLYAYIFATGDLEQWASMSDPECRFCAGAAERVEELFSDGGYATGGAFDVEEVETQESGDADGAVLIALTGTEAPSKEYSRDGIEIRALEGGGATYTFALARERDGWIVIDGSVEAADGL
ncbi:DUF6318 family protein [Georgenia satyanarayanai]|uniref:DUF6318 family protein n=1 Tax=Georgenia satyanarayanai TaxID=860221 RepID=UPI000DA22E8E|nr:DUF6318 family protein [Georgenia satyanarayanai]